MLPDRRALLENAETAHAAGDDDEAAAICTELLDLAPGNLQARTLAGKVAARQGRYPEAISMLDAVVRAGPKSPDSLIWLSYSFRKSGALKAATGVAMKAAQEHPRNAQVLNNLGLCQMELLLLVEAARSFQNAEQHDPETSEHPKNLGTAFYMQGLFQSAAEAYRRAIDLDPRNSEAHVGLGRALLAESRYEDALECAHTAVALDPTLCIGRILMAQLLVQNGRAQEGMLHAESAVELEPDNPLPHSVFGQCLQSQGRMEESLPHFRRSIELDPRQGYPYFGLIYGQKITEAVRPLGDRVRDLLKEPRIPQADVEALHYALGRLHEGLNEHEPAMRHYDEANRSARFVKFRGRPFDAALHFAKQDRAISFFTKDRFTQMEGWGSDSELPVFIVGMIRSGTTLMEQILSSHPDVEGAGELSFWSERGPSAFDPCAGTLSPEGIRSLSEQYLALLRGFGSNARRATDKMPVNTLVLGFIRVAFPNARIIHMNRNPADVCFSIYATPNEGLIDFAHDKASIATAYRAHVKLMDHWRRVIPPDRFMDVHYEDLVEDREAITRQVLEFCGLEWSDLCMFPERNERSVATPSMWQVRQPVYKTSVQRWKNFEPWIEEFVALQSS